VKEDDADGDLVGLAEAVDVLEDVVAVPFDDVFCMEVSIRIAKLCKEKRRTQRNLQKRDADIAEADGEFNDSERMAPALLGAGPGDGAHGGNLVALSAQVMFPESRDREKPF
jgi:hypothetical protein